MMRKAFVLALVLSKASLAESPLTSERQRAITPRDCVTVRDLQHDDSSFRSTIKISGDGTRIAYLVKAPNLGSNENDIELYVRRFPADPADSDLPIFVGSISSLRWLSDSTHLTMLVKEHGRQMLEELDSRTGERNVLIRADTDIKEYSVDKNLSTVVFATEAPRNVPNNSVTEEELATGYQVQFHMPVNVLWTGENLFLSRRTHNGWSTPEPIEITSPLSKQPLRTLPFGNAPDLNPSLSPDGRRLLVSYFDFSEDMPVEWRNSGYMELRNNSGVLQAFHLLVLYDLETHETRVPLKTPAVLYAPLWSSDSKSFVVVAQPAIGSELERANAKTHLIGHSAGAHLFWVEPESGKIEDVASQLAFPWEGPLFWGPDGDLLVRINGMDSITRFSRTKVGWQALSSFQIPLQVGEQLATNGHYVIAEFDTTTTPPQLFAYRPGDKEVNVFAKLNPEFDGLTVAQPREVHWETSSGFNAAGLLLLPPGYKEGTRYPLVIQTKPFATSFVCSFGNFPSFAPQPISNAGIMYLGQITTKTATQRADDYFPKGYPGYSGTGGIAEAVFAMDLWDSAVNALAQQGLIDSSRVGIIGFSRTGWYTEFILAHSKMRYRAATVADNVQYSLGEYWLNHDANTIKSYDLTYGGPPYGSSLNNWLDYSISFNLDKIQTPIMMEQMGRGTHYDNLAAPPLVLADAFEVFTGLNRLNKPVELYYYPNEDHTPDHPRARLATMQRNVDWYRFWLQGYERPKPEDSEQYIRWHKLRELQQREQGLDTHNALSHRSSKD